jgi:two-component system, OmpR family, KDP operon response regulator KdpE
MPRKIFIIDDEADVLISIKTWCEKKGYEVTTFENSDGFLDSLLDVKPDIILVDINLKDDDGRFISEDLKNILPFPIKIILISADALALLDYHSHYADGILNKPFTFADLEKKLNQHLKK